MKTTILIYVLFAVFFMEGCVSDWKDNSHGEEIVPFTEYTWKYESKPDITIMLSFNSRQEEMIVKTSPVDLGFPYLFHNGDTIKYLLSADTLRILNDGVDPDDAPFFIQTVLSADSMNLQYVGFLPAIPYITDYLFIRQISNEGPNDISFTEYSLAETSCQWKHFPYDIGDTVVIINSKEDLEKHLECIGESSYPVIDFSTHTLLFAHGIAPSSVVKANCSSLQQTSEYKYRMKVDIVVGDATVMSDWWVPIIINKLGEECIIELIATTEFHSL
jgi:hypothetical protein